MLFARCLFPTVVVAVSTELHLLLVTLSSPRRSSILTAFSISLTEIPSAFAAHSGSETKAGILVASKSVSKYHSVQFSTASSVAQTARVFWIQTACCPEHGLRTPLEGTAQPAEASSIQVQAQSPQTMDWLSAFLHQQPGMKAAVYHTLIQITQPTMECLWSTLLRPAWDQELFQR